MAADPDHRWHRLHLWQVQIVRDLLVLGFAAGILWLAYELRGIVIPLLLGLLAADLFEPMVRRAMRLHPIITRTRMVVASAALTLCAAACVIAVAMPPLVEQTRQLVRDFPGYVDKAVRLSERPVIPAVIREQIAALHEALAPKAPASAVSPISGETPASVQPAPPPPAIIVQQVGKEHQREDTIRVFARNGMTVVNVVVGSIFQIFDIVVFLFLVPFFAVLFSLNFPRVHHYLRTLPPEPHRNRVALVVRRMERTIGGFFRGRALVCLVLAAVYAIGLTLCSVPYGLLLGLVTGLCCLIPYLHFAGLPLAWLLLAIHLNDASAADGIYSHMTSGGLDIVWWRVLLLPLGVWILAQVLDDYVLSPLIQKQTTDLHPATVILSILGGGMLGGFYGIVLAVPLVACAKILFAEVFLPAVHTWLKGQRADPLPLRP
ncbi:MAG: AI-2E family transporter [Planctomycetes bacterium]|nr:AI-2E family transporter [Planctomycetota bacterium]